MTTLDLVLLVFQKSTPLPRAFEQKSLSVSVRVAASENHLLIVAHQYALRYIALEQGQCRDKSGSRVPILLVCRHLSRANLNLDDAFCIEALSKLLAMSIGL